MEPESGFRKGKGRPKTAHTNMISTIERTDKSESLSVIFKEAHDNSLPAHPPSLIDIQIRAYRIHQRHGAVYGGYTLDDWLEAEHELDEEIPGEQEKKEPVQ